MITFVALLKSCDSLQIPLAFVDLYYFYRHVVDVIFIVSSPTVNSLLINTLLCNVITFVMRFGSKGN